MKAPLCLLLVAGFSWAADEPADRAAIGHVIEALNSPIQSTQVFTAGATRDPLPDPPSAAPRVVISHEVWGEARIEFPSLDAGPRFSPRFKVGAIRFLAPDVALADGSRTYVDPSGSTQSTPLLFVMKKEGDSWKIAAMRVLARQAP